VERRRHEGRGIGVKLLLGFCAGVLLAQAPIPLETLDLSKVSVLPSPMGYPAKAGRSVADKPLTMRGKKYEHGVGLHSGSKMLIDLHGQATQFAALAGVDEAKLLIPPPLPGAAVPKGLQNHPGLATLEVWVDGKRVYDSGVMRRGTEPKNVSVDLTGAKQLLLVATDGGRWPYNNPLDLADASIGMKAGKPETLSVPVDPPPAIATTETKKWGIHGPLVYGASVGRPFFYQIPATGEGTIEYNAQGLPAGLTIDPRTGSITGTLLKAGKTNVQLSIRAAGHVAVRDLTIVAGDRPLALTPPLGWNSWNVWARAVDAEKIRQAADWMVKTGLAAHGYQYINIDDAWMGERNAKGEIQPNERFDDMRALADYVHARGLKIGLYSSPGPLTCQSLPGSFQHEKQDAETYAKWGYDYLKYDMCSYRGKINDPGSREEQEKPYRIMGDALRSLPRDIVFSLCQYGQAGVSEWGPKVGGQAWRTTGDIRDSWESMSAQGFGQNGLEKWAHPGAWNDPDMLVIGVLGWGVEPHQTRLTPNEQLTHITLWSMLSSPLLLGCDLSKLDKFQIDLLTNDEVLDVNQDPLGRQAARRSQDGSLEVWSKPMADGSLAVGLFNRGVASARVTAKWADLGLSEKRLVRDLWQRRDLGSFADAFSAEVPSHGAVLVKVNAAAK
jgi:alpha-galactosidase